MQAFIIRLTLLSALCIGADCDNYGPSPPSSPPSEWAWWVDSVNGEWSNDSMWSKSPENADYVQVCSAEGTVITVVEAEVMSTAETVKLCNALVISDGSTLCLGEECVLWEGPPPSPPSTPPSPPPSQPPVLPPASPANP